MKKLVIISIVAAMLLGLGTVFAQPNQSHRLDVNIPNLVMIRIVDGGNSAEANPAVVFDLTSGAALDALLEMTETVVFGAPTVENFGDVVVFSNRATWRVNVVATEFTRLTGPDISVSGELPLTIGAVSVERSSNGVPARGVSSVASSWTLSTTPAQIANGTQTRGFSSLAFGGADYRLRLEGLEAPGDYQSTVTYSITAP